MTDETKEPVCKTCEDREEICIKVYELQSSKTPNPGCYLERLVEIPCPICERRRRDVPFDYFQQF